MKTTGFLLKRTWLANDDAVLDIFTADLGRITVFVSKLARSKKRQLELDFFRILELELQEKNHNYTLRTVTTQVWLGKLQADYQMTEQLFSVFDNLRNILPEEKALPEFYNCSWQVLQAIDLENHIALLAFWELKALECSGVCPEFDRIRDDVWWQFESFEIFSKKVPHSLLVPNLVRQLLEFFRRHDLPEVLIKAESLPPATCLDALRILQVLATHH